MDIERKIDIKALISELGNNKIDALELLREALSNAKDHGANRLFFRSRRDSQGRVFVTLIDDGEGLNKDRWEAFLGAATSIKERPSIGYKGFGTKLFFQCEKLTIVSRAKVKDPWISVTIEQPSKNDSIKFPAKNLSNGHSLYNDINDPDILKDKTGTVIFIENVLFSGKENLLSREKIESYCDWFTVLADIRAGLFDSRLEFHQAVKKGGPALAGLRVNEVEMRTIEVLLQINGEKKFTHLGQNVSTNKFFNPWSDDIREFSKHPELIMFGHRFADAHVSKNPGGAIKNDLTAIRLTGPEDWADSNGISIVAHVEGQRRQRETYLEAGWQNKKGEYTFDERFGLWLCKDFIPIAQRNDLLREAIIEAQPKWLLSELRSVRNWKFFINDQSFLPIANRGEISNYSDRKAVIFQSVVDLLKQAFKKKEFSDWVNKIRSARIERERNTERSLMLSRQNEIQQWIKDGSPDSLDITTVDLSPLDVDESRLIRPPRNEQELFYLYSLLSSRFEVPVVILEYETKEGVDAIGQIAPNAKALVRSNTPYGRIEFKFEVETGYPINHYFDSIDIIICYQVGRLGIIQEEGASTSNGKLQKRKKPVLTPPLDTHEIVVFDDKGKEDKVIPIIQISQLFKRIKK